MTIILVAFNFFERVLKIINADIESEAMDKEKRKHQMYVTYQII